METALTRPSAPSAALGVFSGVSAAVPQADTGHGVTSPSAR